MVICPHKYRAALLGIACVLLVLPGAASANGTPEPIATPKASPTSIAISPAWECDRLESYHQEMLDLLSDIDGADEVRQVINADDFTRIRPSTARIASEALDEWVSELEDMGDVPRAAWEYHKALTESLGVASTMMLSYASGGAFALLPYAETSEEVNTELAAASQRGYLRCKDQ